MLRTLVTEPEYLLFNHRLVGSELFSLKTYLRHKFGPSTKIVLRLVTEQEYQEIRASFAALFRDILDDDTDWAS